jgi:hypothetical protein
MCAKALGTRLTRLCLALEADGWRWGDPACSLLCLPEFVRLAELELDYTGLGCVPHPDEPQGLFAASAPLAPAGLTLAQRLAPVKALLAPLPDVRPPALRRLRVMLAVRGEAGALQLAAGALEARYAPLLSLELRPC